MFRRCSDAGLLDHGDAHAFEGSVLLVWANVGRRSLDAVLTRFALGLTTELPAHGGSVPAIDFQVLKLAPRGTVSVVARKTSLFFIVHATCLAKLVLISVKAVVSVARVEHQFRVLLVRAVVRVLARVDNLVLVVAQRVLMRLHASLKLKLRLSDRQAVIISGKRD